MATNYVQPGEKIEWTNGTGADVVSGQVVRIGVMLGVAEVDIANAGVGTCCTEGVFSVPKLAATVFAQGDAAMWDASGANFSKEVAAAGDVTGSAIVWKAAGAGATTVIVKINANVGTVTP